MPIAERLSGKNVRAWVSMVLYLKKFYGPLLVLGLKEGLVECATVYVKSEVILSMVFVGIDLQSY